jgi:hypothetical protein
VKGFAYIGARRQRVTPHLHCVPRFARHLALRAQHPLSRQLRLNVKRPEWQLSRQSGFAGTDAVADANRYTALAKPEKPLKVGKTKNHTSKTCSYKTPL